MTTEQLAYPRREPELAGEDVRLRNWARNATLGRPARSAPRPREAELRRSCSPTSNGRVRMIGSRMSPGRLLELDRRRRHAARPAATSAAWCRAPTDTATFAGATPLPEVYAMLSAEGRCCPSSPGRHRRRRPWPARWPPAPTARGCSRAPSPTPRCRSGWCWPTARCRSSTATTRGSRPSSSASARWASSRRSPCATRPVADLHLPQERRQRRRPRRRPRDLEPGEHPGQGLVVPAGGPGPGVGRRRGDPRRGRALPRQRQRAARARRLERHDERDRRQRPCASMRDDTKIVDENGKPFRTVTRFRTSPTSPATSTRCSAAASRPRRSTSRSASRSTGPVR